MKFNNKNQWLTWKDVISWTNLSASTIHCAVNIGKLKASTATGKTDRISNYWLGRLDEPK